MLEKEESIRQRLVDKFEFLKENCAVVRARRIKAEAPGNKVPEVLAFAKNELGFSALCTITALDSGENLEMIYHVANGGVVLNLKALVPKTNPVFETVTGLYEGATMYELEAHNLLGIQVNGIPEGIRYPLSDDWPEGQYPLRKDWNKEAPAGAQEGS